MRVLLVGGAGNVGKLITPYLKLRHTVPMVLVIPRSRKWPVHNQWDM